MTAHLMCSCSRLAMPGLAALALIVAAPAFAADPAPAHGAPVDQALFKALQWRGIGPYRGGRALAVTGVPGAPDTFYFGAAAGGVWKTTDAGNSWKPIFDSQPMSSIGAIAVAPSNPEVIYVGSGEAALRGDITYGDGVYKSADGGKTWSHIGLTDSRQIGAVIVDPTNPDIVLVAAMGHAFGPNSERGVFRSTDGGKTWTKTLYKDEHTGAIDVTFDPSNPKIVYAAMWQAQRQPWNFSSGGPGSGLYRSADGGATWTELKGHGLPEGMLGRIDVSVSAADPHRIYAMIEAKDGGLYRSDDAGTSWKRISEDGRIRQRAWYFSKIYADPKSVDTVYALNTGMLKSTDGGKSFGLVSATHGDHHGLWIDPADPRRLINCNDGGASISLDGGLTWSTQDNQPTGQYYHVSVSPGWPYWIYGAQQDNSNVAIASYDDEGVITERDWFAAGGGESGFVVGDPRDPKIIYSDAENQFARYDKAKEQDQDISPWPVDNSGHPASELLHRFNWTSPLLLSPHNPDVLYAASEVVWKSTDRGNSWTIVSGDLTRNDKTKQIASGGPLTKDITSVEYYDTIFALAESSVKQGLLWAGSDDGLVHVTSDGGAHWSDVTPKDLPAWSTISMVEPSPHDSGVAYLAVDRHKLDDIKPYAYRTADGGKTWTAITAGLPDGAVVHAVREDPVRRGLLYAATEKGVFVSFDNGGLWQSLQQNLPATPVHDLAIKGDDLVAATHGRSFWVLDDLNPLRQIGPDTDRQAAVLYAPQTALRLHYPDQVDSRRPVGDNPPAGALIDYVLKAEPQGELTIDILGADGAVVRHLSSAKSDKEVQPPEWPDQIVPDDRIPAKAGMNRLVWDLRMSDPAQIPGAFYSGPTPRGPLVPPGRYQVKLSVGGQTLTAPLTVVADPRLHDADAAIRAKTDLAVATEADIDRLHKAVNAVRKTRTDLAGAKQAMAGKKSAPALIAEADRLNSALDPIEQALMQVNMKGSEANLAFPGMLNEQFASFALALEDADTAPTAQHRAMYQSLHAQLDAVLAKWQALQANDLTRFNAKLEAAANTQAGE
ncbi:VPS10 domain-containing protein [Phenylobacterium montanum]|uniref:Sortilin N-terminal domain-containing protein n=1 Tax=Phenylobacterium montanum TaxID=2823693 RepID=A0A975IVX1_9CAUL|nr:hypothetical protein [Caulobacter sp. S6]QUD89283.1 hypothetical protein KCG34_05230 [Caulobacter sp. S6]